MQTYLELLRSICAHGEPHEDRTGVGTISLWDTEWRHEMSQGFPLLTTKKVFMRGITEELSWFLRGETNQQLLAAKGVHIWDEWATAEQCAKFGREAGDLGPGYGYLWRHFGGHYPSRESGVDQIANLCAALAARSNSRRLIVSGWHAKQQSEVELPPCHTLWQCKIHPHVKVRRFDGNHHVTREGPGLSLKLYARSIDAFLGLPFNIASYALLLELLCWTHDLIPCRLGISFGDLHIYRNHLQQVNTQVGREPRPLPAVKLSERLRGAGLKGLLEFGWDDVSLYRYNPHPPIKAEVAV